MATNRIKIPTGVAAVPGIYRLLNTVTGDCYVGGTKDLLLRLRNHRNHLGRGEGSYRVQESYDAHPGAFVIEIIEVCSMAQLQARETYWIQQLEPALNTWKSVQNYHCRKPISEQAKAIVRLVKLSGVAK